MTNLAWKTPCHCKEVVSDGGLEAGRGVVGSMSLGGQSGAGLGGRSRRSTYLSMTTAGVWLAIVANVLLLRAAAALVSAQQIQQGMLKSERGAVSRACRQAVELRSKITSGELPGGSGTALRPCQEGWMPRKSMPRQLRRLETVSAQPGYFTGNLRPLGHRSLQLWDLQLGANTTR